MRLRKEIYVDSLVLAKKLDARKGYLCSFPIKLPKQSPSRVNMDFDSDKHILLLTIPPCNDAEKKTMVTHCRSACYDAAHEYMACAGISRHIISTHNLFAFSSTLDSHGEEPWKLPLNSPNKSTSENGQETNQTDPQRMKPSELL